MIDVLAADEAEAVDAARSVTWRSSRARRGVGRAPTRSCCAAPSPRTRSASTTPARCSACSPTPARCSSCAPGFGRTIVTALARIEGRPVGVIANDPRPPQRRDRRRRLRQGGPLHPALRRVRAAGRLARRHARLHGRPRQRARRRWCAAPRACSSPPRALTVPFVCVVVRRALRPRRAGDGRRRLPRAGRSTSRGRAASSARWASRARCGWRCARSSRRSPTRPSASSGSRELVAAVRAESGALNMAAYFEIDDVIDPAETRGRIVGRARRRRRRRPGRRRTMVDSW